MSIVRIRVLQSFVVIRHHIDGVQVAKRVNTSGSTSVNSWTISLPSGVWSTLRPENNTP